MDLTPDMIVGSITGLNFLAWAFYAGVYWQKSRFAEQRFDEISRQLVQLDKKISNGLRLEVLANRQAIAVVEERCAERKEQIDKIEQRLAGGEAS